MTLLVMIGHRTCDSHFAGSSPDRAPSRSGLASVTKQYNLVPAKGRLRSAAVKVTVGLASHWLSVADLVVYRPMSSWPKEGR